MAASFSIIAISVRRYAPVILWRYWFWTSCSGLSKLLAGVPLLFYTPYTWAPYNITGWTVAVYKRRERRINGPYINIVIRNITLKAIKPLATAFLIYSFY